MEVVSFVATWPFHISEGFSHFRWVYGYLGYLVPSSSLFFFSLLPFCACCCCRFLIWGRNRGNRGGMRRSLEQVCSSAGHLDAALLFHIHIEIHLFVNIKQLESNSDWISSAWGGCGGREGVGGGVTSVAARWPMIWPPRANQLSINCEIDASGANKQILRCYFTTLSAISCKKTPKPPPPPQIRWRRHLV